MIPDWDLIWPARAEWVARIIKYMPPEAHLIPDILIVIAEYGSSYLLTWDISGRRIMHDFCPWRDIQPFNRSDFFTPWAKYISGLATINTSHGLVDLLSDHRWYIRSISAIALSRAHDQYDCVHFKTELPRDAYVIYDMAFYGDAAIKNTMGECQDPIALGYHHEYSSMGYVTFQSDIF